jgi:hypothetical protein
MTTPPTALRRIGIGFLYGFGFAAGFAVAAVVAMFAIPAFFSGERTSFPSVSPRDAPIQPGRFTFSNTDVVRDQFGKLLFIGTFEDRSGDATRYVNVYADLFDKGGKFIYQCWTQFKGPLPIGEKTNFMIQCHGAPQETIDRYDSFKVYARAM